MNDIFAELHFLSQLDKRHALIHVKNLLESRPVQCNKVLRYAPSQVQKEPDSFVMCLNKELPFGPDMRHINKLFPLTVRTVCENILVLQE
ncbi:hypothetical protein NPIL_513601 [Nephila pilipes]|uniref:Uncharacterized protein n=1 Tax=Nephila pilipes TaxID=299642 RepID=A0A8X6Q342_NEPPI|nr:hypothetical protein NPIL_513601 [Nephila pilipes]